MLKKVLINTGAQTLGKALTAATTLTITVIIGRSLGPSGYGDFTKIFTFVGYFYTFADFGLNAAYVKLTQKDDQENLIRYLLSLRLVVAIVLAISAIVISRLLPYDPVSGTGFGPIVRAGIAIASLTIVTQAAFTTFNAFFQIKLRYDLSAICAVFGTIIILLVSLLVSSLRPSIYLFSWAYVIGGIAFSICAYLAVLKNFKWGIRPSFSIKNFKKLLDTSWPIGIALIFNLVYFRSDIFILSYTKESAQVGIYGLAYQFFEASLSIPIFFTNALFPLLSKLYAENKKLYQVESKKWIYILLAFSILTTIGLILVSFLIPLVFERFTGSQLALIILSFGMPSFFISALLWHLAIILGKQKTLIPVYLSGGVVNVALNLALIPRYGYLAAATTTVISEAIIVAMLAYIVMRAQKTSSQV